MAQGVVDQATSDALMGPNWAINFEICDLVNSEPLQTKEFVKAIKKRITHKNPKTQLLTLTLLEALVNNCGDLVHACIQEKCVLTEMVKIAQKKRTDFCVKEKILILIDTWQEAFGGPHSVYSSYYFSYLQLLRAGEVFPQRTENSVPIFMPPQTHPVQNYPQTFHNEEPEPSPIAKHLSLSELENARAMMDILYEMLDALDPGNIEGLRQDTIVDLENQVRSFKQQLIELVNTTSNEDLLTQGLALNDDLQKVLALHDAIAAGILIQKPKEEASEQQPENKMVKVDYFSMDLLSGDDFAKPGSSKDQFAIVPVQSDLSADDQNVLALCDMFANLDSQNNSNNNNNNVNNGESNNNSMALKVCDPQAQTNDANSQFNNGLSSQSGALPLPPWESDQSETLNYPIQQVAVQPMTVGLLSAFQPTTYSNNYAYPQYQQLYGPQIPAYYAPAGNVYNNPFGVSTQGNNNNNYVNNNNNAGNYHQNDAASSSNSNGEYLAKRCYA